MTLCTPVARRPSAKGSVGSSWALSCPRTHVCACQHALPMQQAAGSQLLGMLAHPLACTHHSFPSDQHQVCWEGGWQACMQAACLSLQAEGREYH